VGALGKMVALDTNVLLRYLLDDHEAQSRSAKILISSLNSTNKAFIGREVLLEVIWVLNRIYKVGRLELSKILFHILNSSEFIVEDAESLEEALGLFQNSQGDLSDLLILSHARQLGALPLVTFDKKLAEYEGVSLLN